MVHCRSLLQMLLHTLQYVDLDCTVRETDTEELGFKFLETLLVLHRFFAFLLNFLLFSLFTGKSTQSSPLNSQQFDPC